MSHYSIEARKDTKAELMAEVAAGLSAIIQSQPEHAPAEAAILSSVNAPLALLAEKPGMDYRVVVNGFIAQSDGGLDEIHCNVCVGLQFKGTVT